MKQPKIKVSLALVCAILLFCAGCSNGGAIIDKNTEIENQNWAYVNRVRFDVKVDDDNTPYNLYLNLRVTADYKYSNVFVLVTESGPGVSAAAKRYEFTLAAKDGQWLGEGSGNLYSYQLPFVSNYKFPAKGTYTFYIEQNMRDNPLRAVSDVGLRISPAGQK
jgi:gliding motility-associated lipoprotein GldH